MTDEAKTEMTKEEVAAELQGRVDEFNKELLPLLGKYELGLGATAFIAPDGRIASRPIMFDARGAVAKDDAEAPAEAAPEAPAAPTAA